MARPKPPEDKDEIALRPPLSVGKKIRERAAEAGMGAGPWCVAVLTWALENNVAVSLTPTVTGPLYRTDSAFPSSRLNEDPAPYGTPKKTPA